MLPTVHKVPHGLKLRGEQKQDQLLLPAKPCLEVHAVDQNAEAIYEPQMSWNAFIDAFSKIYAQAD